MKPLLLEPDNWTPPARTPWGGRVIAEQLKAGLSIDPEKAAWRAIGESWELSFDPAFPSRDRAGRRLEEHFRLAREAWLGADATHPERVTSLLVKLLDAREALSVQVHPAGDDPALAPSESGKPEAWVVLDREPGAGVWLGLAEGVGREDLAHALTRGPERAGAVDAIESMLNFVPVEVGDAFVIEAGTVHAIGAGVTLIEPQWVRPGRTGVTYRLWDWSRRYDREGRLDARGAPRPLHQERCLAVIRWDTPRGASFVASCRREPRVLVRTPGATVSRCLEVGGMVLQRWQGRGALDLGRAGEPGAWAAPLVGRFMALIVVAGQVSLDGVVARRGETLAVPAACEARTVTLDEADAFVVRPR